MSATRFDSPGLKLSPCICVSEELAVEVRVCVGVCVSGCGLGVISTALLRCVCVRPIAIAAKIGQVGHALNLCATVNSA